MEWDEIKKSADFIRAQNSDPVSLRTIAEQADYLAKMVKDPKQLSFKGQYHRDLVASTIRDLANFLRSAADRMEGLEMRDLSKK